MGSLSDYAELELLDHIFNAAYSPVATVYIGLSTADPLDNASGLAAGEPSGNNYGRKSIAFNAAASRKVENTSQITFNQASGSWGTITHWFICDHETNTTWGTNVNLLAHGSFTTGKSVVSGNTPSIAAQEIDVQFNAGYISDNCAAALLDLMFRNQSPVFGDTYIALCTANVSDNNTGSTITEPSGNNYSRLRVYPNSPGTAPNWSVASVGSVTNATVAIFATPSGLWGTITAMAIVSAASNGTLLVYDNAVTEQQPNDGDTVKFSLGGLKVSMS